MADFSWVPTDLTGRFLYVDNKLHASCEVCGALKQTAGRGHVLKTIEKYGSDRFRFCAVHGGGTRTGFSRSEIASWPEGHKRCVECKEIKSFDDFHKHKQCLFGINTICRECRLPKSKAAYSKMTYEYKLFHAAKSRASQKGREFDIELDDVFIPDECPVFKVPFAFEPNHPHAPSIDRIDSSKGYTPDNIIVMTRRANVLKNDMSLSEARMIVSFLESLE